jgi:hypothetical protein
MAAGRAGEKTTIGGVLGLAWSAGGAEVAAAAAGGGGLLGGW